MQRNLRFKLTAALSLALATAACAADPERSKEAQAIADTINVAFHHAKWRQVPATPENQAETVVFEQRVAFGPDTALLDRAGQAAIDRLLSEAAPAPGSVLRLSVAGGQGGTAGLDRMALQRLESVRAALAARGYESALADSAAARVAALGDNEIGLTVSRIVAVLPDCRQPQPLAPERPEFTSAFGCTTAYNLGVMIADPADLERGRELDPADAERAGLSIQRYRAGEEEPLEDVSSTSQ